MPAGCATAIWRGQAELRRFEVAGHLPMDGLFATIGLRRWNGVIGCNWHAESGQPPEGSVIMPGFSLVNLGNITKPATVLIEKSSEAVRGAMLPRQIRRVGSAETDVETERIRAVAQAEADAAVIRAEGEIQITDLHRRAVQRSILEDTEHQLNMESILGKAIPQLEPNASPEDVENDWYTNFYSKCRITSDEGMQDLWARILAGQANNPGAFSRKTVNLVADLDKRDAELFTALCRFVWVVNGRIYPLVFDLHANIYNNYGINFNAIVHLESLGMVHFSGISGFQIRNLPESVTVTYCGLTVSVLTFDRDGSNCFSTGVTMFTQAGLELARVVNASGIPEIYNYVYDRWASDSLVPPREPDPEA